jgi:hypothetical protein
MFEFDTLMYYDFYNTLDIDFGRIPDVNLSCSFKEINEIIIKILQCHNLKGITREPSNKKGYHLRLYCHKRCDKCRIVFDDFIRRDADTKRKKEFTNIIFDTKKGY